MLFPLGILGLIGVAQSEHAKVSADGFAPLTTHIFDRASEYLDSETVFGVKQSLIEDFVADADADADADGVLVCEHDFVLSRP